MPARKHFNGNNFIGEFDYKNAIIKITFINSPASKTIKEFKKLKAKETQIIEDGKTKDYYFSIPINGYKTINDLFEIDKNFSINSCINISAIANENISDFEKETIKKILTENFNIYYGYIDIENENIYTVKKTKTSNNFRFDFNFNIVYEFEKKDLVNTYNIQNFIDLPKSDFENLFEELPF